MQRFGKWKYLGLELATQLERIKYAWATSKGMAYCPFPPRKIAIEPSSFCNLRCIHCAHGYNPAGGERMTRKKSNMDMELYKKIVREAAGFCNRTKFVFAMMGEPLMHKRLVEMISYAHKHGVWTQVNTNCTMLTKQKGRELIEAGVDFVYLSLDGITKKTYEQIRVRGDFDDTLTNILDFIELKYELGAKDLVIHIGMTAEIINRNELDVFVKEFSKLPIDSVYSPMLFNWLDTIEWVDKTEEQKKEIPFSQYPVCNSPYDIIGIQSSGDIVPCMYDFDGRYVSGNVADASILEIWNNERTQNFRRAIVNRDYDLIEENGAMCSQCTLLWNPHYQVKPEFTKGLAQIGKYTLKAFRDFSSTDDRQQRLYEKYKYLKEFRNEFVEGLAKFENREPDESQAFKKVAQDGVLEVRL